MIALSSLVDSLWVASNASKKQKELRFEMIAGVNDNSSGLL